MDVIDVFTHCPRCGNVFNKELSYLKCETCGLHYYLNPKPCTTVVLYNEKRQYLFVERASDPKKGWWDLPGGFIETNETFEDGARREVKEELGIDLDEINYIGSFYDKYDYQGVAYTTLAVNYIGKLPSKAKITPADDVAGYELFALSDIPLDKIAFPSMLETVELLKKIKI